MLELWASLKIAEYKLGFITFLLLLVLMAVSSARKSGLTKRAADGLRRLYSWLRGAIRRR